MFFTAQEVRIFLSCLPFLCSELVRTSALHFCIFLLKQPHSFLPALPLPCFVSLFAASGTLGRVTCRVDDTRDGGAYGVAGGAAGASGVRADGVGAGAAGDGASRDRMMK